MKWLKRIFAAITVLFIAPLLVAACSYGDMSTDWRTADRSSAGMAPDPATEQGAVVQVYAARAFNWRGIFAVHTWIAVKPANHRHFTIHEVLGWRARSGNPAVISRIDAPDRYWFGARPEILRDIRGDAAAALIPKIEDAAESYSYQRDYVIWPGPNSNTFIAHIARQVPELRLDLPPTAIGKDYLPDGGLVGAAPSNTGFQVSLFGLLGLIVAAEEGIELNVLTLGVGLDPLELALRLPGIGKVGVLQDQ
jgi:hypothetical protein